MLQSFKAKKNDMVTTQTSIPDGTGKIIKVNVWGKIASINCSNEWFPRQAAQEMAFQNINVEDTPLPTSRDELICKVNILGYTKQDDKEPKLLPMVYPVKPANAVSYPNSSDVEKLLISDLNSKHPIHIGTLLARDNVNIKIDADSLVSRHVLVTGMSGSGKTVMVRRIIAELMRLHFPMLVYDIHGDYLGFVKKQKLFPNNKIKLFYPSLSVKAEDKEIIYTLINKLGKPLTEPQNDYLNTLLNKVKFDETSIIKFLNSLISFSKGLLDTKNSKSKNSNSMPHIKPATMFVVNRSLSQVVKKLVNMENTNARHRQRMSKYYDFEKLPDANTEPEKITGRLSRKDRWMEAFGPHSDWVGVAFDSNNDDRTGYWFAVNPAGSRMDVYVSDATNVMEAFDSSWDVVWEFKTAIHDQGWTIEMKIPMSVFQFDADTNEDLVGSTLVWASFCSLLGCFIATLISNRFGLIRPLLIALITMATGVGLLSFGITEPKFLMSVFTFNLLWIFTDVYQMGSLANFDNGGRYSAYLPASQGLGQIVGPNLAASILSFNLGYESVFMMCWAAAMMAMVIYWLLHRYLRATDPKLADAS